MMSQEIGNHAWRLRTTIKMYIIMSLGKDDVAVRNRNHAWRLVEQARWLNKFSQRYGDCISQVCV